ncbi:BglG family transcription antiterminator [Cytobacillus gottheilii]|uniref:BglG family transcription antiterminator n=1 Tax=Cytobacillus gottheilii TaxID=859144 RepID=UPI0009B9987E|nr:BglG family transcription antiterminator [Cytobacillus gottheilii]
MYISARERKILELLLLQPGETTVKEIAKELEVSSRTIHRDLKGVEEILKEYGLELNKKSGIGIGVTGEEEKKEMLRLFLFNLSHNEYTPEERQTMILSALLDAAEPVKLVSLANDLNVTIATVSNDLNKVEERLTPFDLTLLRKRGYGVELIGTESSKRKAMSKIIIENIDEFEFLSLIKENIQKRSAQVVDTVTDRLLGLVDKTKLLIIEKQIEDIKNDLPYAIADSAYIGLVVHLALAIERIQQGEEINFEDDYLNSLKGTREYKAAAKIVLGLEEVFKIDISQGEIGYITMHLMGAKLRNDHDDLLGETSLHAGVLAQNLMTYVSRKLDIDLTTNNSLFQGLVAHLRPALHRIKQNMGISNPLLERIEQDYKELFIILQQGMANVLPELKVPREEIGYLVMHFASALLNSEETSPKNALVICSSGIGTSKILSTKLEQELPGLSTINASIFDLDQIDIHKFDAVISTIPLKNFNRDYLLVSPLLTVGDIDKIKQFFAIHREAGHQVKQSIRLKQRQSYDDFRIRISKVKRSAAAIEQLLEHFSLTVIEEDLSIPGILHQMSTELYQQGVITDSKGITEDLLKREQLGGLGIPETQLALYHTRSTFVKEPCFMVRRVKNPLSIKGMDGSDMMANTILLLLSPMNESEEALELLSAISSLIIRDEHSISVFQTGGRLDIANLLADELQLVFENKYSQV